jgi:hypothetical protein
MWNRRVENEKQYKLKMLIDHCRTKENIYGNITS